MAHSTHIIERGVDSAVFGLCSAVKKPIRRVEFCSFACIRIVMASVSSSFPSSTCRQAVSEGTNSVCKGRSQPISHSFHSITFAQSHHTRFHIQSETTPFKPWRDYPAQLGIYTCVKALPSLPSPSLRVKKLHPTAGLIWSQVPSPPSAAIPALLGMPLSPTTVPMSPANRADLKICPLSFSSTSTSA